MNGSIGVRQKSVSIPQRFQDISKKLVRHFGNAEIRCVLGYGTRIDNPEMVDGFSDYDVTVVFSGYPTRLLPRLPRRTNITVLLWPFIEVGGVEFFRLYNHGEFYLIVLSEAVTLYGTNPFIEMAWNLPKESVISSLREQVLLHCAKLADIALLVAGSSRKRDIVKYSLRIGQNLFFVAKGSVEYSLFRNVGFSEWVRVIGESGLLSKNIVGYLEALVEGQESCPLDSVFQFVDAAKREIVR